MRTDFARDLHLTAAGHPARCKRCRDRLKVKGDIYVVEGQPVPSVDGREAHPMIWVCRPGGHIRTVGYTRAVDFSRNLPPVRIPDEDLRLGEPDEFDTYKRLW